MGEAVKKQRTERIRKYNVNRVFAIESTPVLFRHVVLGEFQVRLVYTVLGDIGRPCLKNKQKPRPLLALIKYPAVLEPDGLLLKLLTELTQGKIELTRHGGLKSQHSRG